MSDEAVPILNIDHFQHADQSFARPPSVPSTPLSFKTETQSHDAPDMAKTVNIKREREGSSCPSERAAKNPKIEGLHEDELKPPGRAISAASEASVIPSCPSVPAPDTTWVHPSRLNLVRFPTQDVPPSFNPQQPYSAVGPLPPTGPRRAQTAGLAQDLETIGKLEKALCKRKGRLEEASTKLDRERSSIKEAKKVRDEVEKKIQPLLQERDKAEARIQKSSSEERREKDRIRQLRRSIADAENEIKKFKRRDKATDGSVWMRI